jgi:hypothetical protein
MKTALRQFVWVASLVLVGLANGADPAEEAVRRQRFKFLEARTAEFELQTEKADSKLLERGKSPILRWSNPVREFVNDGLTYLWLDGNRPLAIGSCWCRSTEADLRTGELKYEFSTLTDERMSLRRGQNVIWTPKPEGVVNKPLAEAQAPQDTAVRRLTQMRQLARRFQAASFKMNSPHELRLMPQPLYRYDDKANDVLDGALFAFVEGNDPEALLLLEAVSGKWRYTLASMTNYRVVVRLDKDEVFTSDAPPGGKSSPTDRYVSDSDGRFELDGVPDEKPKAATTQGGK